MSPAFAKLEELNTLMNEAKKQLKESQTTKSKIYFTKATETKQIANYRSDKRELHDLI